METIQIKSERLLLAPLSHEEMQAIVLKERDPIMKQAYCEMLEAMRNLPGREEWATNWRICLPTGQIIGGACFKGEADEEGAVEIGYGINEPHRNCGYATEAVGALARWALKQPDVRCVWAQTEQENAASQSVLTSNGFIPDGLGEEGPRFALRRCNPSPNSNRPASPPNRH